MRAGRRAALIALLLICAVPTGASAARLTNLSVNGADDPWLVKNTVVLTWSYHDPSSTSVVTSFEYRVIGARRTVLMRGRADPPDRTATFAVPGPGGEKALPPGRYTVELWANEHPIPGGAPLPPDPILGKSFGFDDRPLGQAALTPAATWLRGDAEPALRISRPPDPQPVSGIRGYAYAVNRNAPVPPCAGTATCEPAEINLPGNATTIRLGRLPEGRHHVSAVAVSRSGMRSADASTAVVGIDASLPEIALNGSGGGWSNQPVRVIARASDPLSGMAAAGVDGPRTTLVVDGGAPVLALGDEAATTVAGSGVHLIEASARDAVGNVRGEDSGIPPVTGVVRIDEAPPTLAFVRSGDPAEPERIEATVADALSGVAARGTIGVRALGSGGPFEPLPTSVAGGRLSARWDSDAYPDGSYEFRATGYDVAGNEGSTGARASGAAMVLVNPVKTRTALRFGFGGKRLVWHRCKRRGESRRCRREVLEPFSRRPARRLVPYGQRPQVGGRLETESGAPLGGRRIELVEVFAAGARMPSRVTRVETAADGSFLARLAPGPSRRLEARFGGSALLTDAAGAELELGVRSLVRMRASGEEATIGGAPVVFSGRIGAAEARIPSYGRPVQLQFRLPGVPWTEFRTVQTDPLGRFRFPYSLTDDDSRGIRFLFRAYAPPQPGWPYEPAASLPVAVTGR